MVLRMRSPFRPVLFAGIALAAIFLASLSTAAPLGADLRQQMQSHPEAQSFPVILWFTEQVDLADFDRGRASAGALIVSLRETARRSQAPMAELLARRGIPFRSFWIDNCMALSASRDLLTELAGRADVDRIDFDVPVRMPECKTEAGGGRSTGWNLNMVRAPEVWSVLGLDGTGIVVGSMDTGADIDHPALAGKWRGGPNSWMDLVNGMSEPYDDHGHGTHTIGTMVGGDGPGPFIDDIGLAYNATFISVKVLDWNNSFSSASIVISGAQWMLDPDGNPGTDDFPHVINNSWYFFSATYSGFHGSAAAWQAAGIIPVFCIGNEGPAASTTRPPANYNNVLGIGATTAADGIASFSSRGPSPVGTVFPADRRKPDLSAPGEAVRSSVPGGSYEFWSGTSMATPHVAATAALMRQANPTLGYTEIKDALFATAVDLGTAGYDYNFGYGRLDAYEALVEIGAGASIEPTGTVMTGTLRTDPNPFRDALRIEYSGPTQAGLVLTVFDIRGRIVRSFRPDGPTGSLAWDGRDAAGREVPSGAYLVRLTASGADGGTAVDRRVVRIRGGLLR